MVLKELIHQKCPLNLRHSMAMVGDIKGSISPHILISPTTLDSEQESRVVYYVIYLLLTQIYYKSKKVLEIFYDKLCYFFSFPGFNAIFKDIAYS